VSNFVAVKTQGAQESMDTHARHNLKTFDFGRNGKSALCAAQGKREQKAVRGFCVLAPTFAP
jgi:hypothetical protein